MSDSIDMRAVDRAAVQWSFGHAGRTACCCISCCFEKCALEDLGNADLQNIATGHADIQFERHG